MRSPLQRGQYVLALDCGHLWSWDDSKGDVPAKVNCIHCEIDKMPPGRKGDRRTIPGTAKMVRPHWENDLFIHAGSVVGMITQGAEASDWFAYGCMADWQDTPLGCWNSEREARKVVEAWVRDHSES